MNLDKSQEIVEEKPQPEAEKKQIPIDWAESDWFKMWLKLARQERGNE